MVRFLAALCLLLAGSLGAAAKPKPFIEITLETQEAFLGDTIVIEVRWSGLLDPIDFSVLEHSADLVRETLGTRIAVVEGQVIEIASRRIELQPRQVGLLTLGPLQADGITSNSVSIDVTEPRSVSWVPGEEDVRLTQTLSEPNPWLQQQVVFDIEFRTRHPVFDEVVMLPTFDGFRIVPVFTERRTLEETDGGWSKTAWRYLLFPQRSGVLTLPGARFIGMLTKSRAERGAFDLAAVPTEVEVKPSAFGPGVWWVAASSLAISDAWSSDPTKLSAGDEVERVITVSATGVLPEQLPGIAMGETRGLTITPLGVERQGKIVGDEAQATASFRFRVRAMSPVPVFLDTVRLRWWNTAENQAAEAIIPARRIDIGIPARGTLVDGALAEQGKWDRLLALTASLDWFAYGAVLGAVVFVPLVAVTGRARLSTWLKAWRMRRELTVLAAQGEAAAFYERIRFLAREKGPLGAAARQVLAELEQALYGRGAAMPNLHDLARRASRSMSRTDRRAGSNLPSL